MSLFKINVYSLLTAKNVVVVSLGFHPEWVRWREPTSNRDIAEGYSVCTSRTRQPRLNSSPYLTLQDWNW